MKKVFFDIYERLYDEYIYTNGLIYRRPPQYDKDYNVDSEYDRRILHVDHEAHYSTEYDIVSKIIDSINRADSKYHPSLRPDAKYFLLVNFHHLIVRPLFIQESYRESFYLEIAKDIEDDISRIVYETKQNPEQGEISGHKIMDTINKLWKDLTTTQLEIWGEDE